MLATISVGGEGLNILSNWLIIAFEGFLFRLPCSLLERMLDIFGVTGQIRDDGTK
jgi:hypothetical protein